MNLSEWEVKREVLVDALNGEGGKVRHIVFASDKNYAPYVGVAMFSVLENNRDMPLHFHILTDNLDGESAAELAGLHGRPEYGFRNFAVTVHTLDACRFSGLYSYGYFSSAMYYRFAMPDILAGETDDALYLDVDTLCIGSLQPLFELDMADAVAAVHYDYTELPNLYALEPFGFPKTAVYFNSGVMRINLSQWAQRGISRQLADKLREIGRRELLYPDQDILNIVLAHQVVYISERFNWRHAREKPQQLSGNPADIRIVHYSGAVKPWQLAGREPTYHDYYSRSPWRDIPYLLPTPDTAAGDLRRLVKRLWREGSYDQALHYWKCYLGKGIAKKLRRFRS